MTIKLNQMIIYLEWNNNKIKSNDKEIRMKWQLSTKWQPNLNEMSLKFSLNVAKLEIKDNKTKLNWLYNQMTV